MHSLDKIKGVTDVTSSASDRDVISDRELFDRGISQELEVDSHREYHCSVLESKIVEVGGEEILNRWC